MDVKHFVWVRTATAGPQAQIWHGTEHPIKFVSQKDGNLLFAHRLRDDEQSLTLDALVGKYPKPVTPQKDD